MYESQYAFIKRNPEKYAAHARKYYHKVKQDPVKWALRQQKRREWEVANKDAIRSKQREDKRARKLEAIKFLGGKCQDCGNEYHPAVYEFHHRNPE
jgi:ribosomal protein L44E